MTIDAAFRQRKKVLPTAFLLILLFAGCAPKDPIDRFAWNHRKDDMFGNGFWTPVKLPEKAPIADVVAKVLELGSGQTNAVVLESRQVEIPLVPANGGFLAAGCTYIAVLVKVPSGTKIVLLQFHNMANHAEWVGDIYDPNE